VKNLPSGYRNTLPAAVQTLCLSKNPKVNNEARPGNESGQVCWETTTAAAQLRTHGSLLKSGLPMDHTQFWFAQRHILAAAGDERIALMLHLTSFA